jgi:hypothetical protein
MKVIHTLMSVMFAAQTPKWVFADVMLFPEDHLYWQRFEDESLDSFVVPTIPPDAPVPFTDSPAVAPSTAPVIPPAASVVVPSVAPVPPSLAPIELSGPTASPTGPPTFGPTPRPISEPISSPTTGVLCSVEVSLVLEWLNIHFFEIVHDKSLNQIMYFAFYSACTGHNRMCHGRQCTLSGNRETN